MPRKVLFIVDEAYPLYKLGGLGDVGGSLPIALSEAQVDVQILLPFHPEIKADNFSLESKFTIQYDNETLDVELYRGVLPNSSVPSYLLKENKYISQKTDASDNHADKFAVFSLACCEWLHNVDKNWNPEVVHLHDWHTALIPVIAKEKFNSESFKYVITVHNLMYQGRTDTPVLEKMGFNSDSIAFKKSYSPENKLNILLEGLLASDAITIVSPNYLNEILTPEYGENIEDHLIKMKQKMVGILNGLDLETFNASKDPHINYHYDATTVLDGKKKNKKELLAQLNLDQDLSVPLVGFVGRVDPGQKGVQLIINLIEQNYFEEHQAQFVFLGTGDPNLEDHLHKVAENRDLVRIFTRYDEPLASKIYAASDFAVIPSKFEPCGLVQLIAMRYGTIPVARKTGGLADTIRPNLDGFLFEAYDTSTFSSSLTEALESFTQKKKFTQMILAGMMKDFSWYTSALDYIKVYVSLTHRQ